MLIFADVLVWGPSTLNPQTERFNISQNVSEATNFSDFGFYVLVRGSGGGAITGSKTSMTIAMKKYLQAVFHDYTTVMIPRPSIYPLLDPKYPFFGAIYPYLRAQGGSW